MIKLGRRGVAAAMVLAGCAALGGGAGIAALTTGDVATPAALVTERAAAVPPQVAPPPSTVAPTATAAPSTTPTATPRASRTAAATTTPVATRSRTAAPDAASSGSGVVAQVVRLTNRARAEAGCAPVRVDPRATRAAQAHSEDMAQRDSFDHESSDGRDFADRMRAAGHPSPGAENIARGQRTAAAVMAAWLDSPGHRRNILDCDLTTVGVGYVADGAYWTQTFGR